LVLGDNHDFCTTPVALDALCTASDCHPQDIVLNLFWRLLIIL
jgi:hypothetical protein